MDYTPNIDAQGMRRPMGPVDQPNWNGGPKLIHNPQVMNNQTVGQPNLANAMANQRPIIPIRGRIVTSEQDIVPAEIPMDGSICLFMTEDCKKVIAKQWNSNGVLQSIIYSISSNEQAAINKLELTASQCAQNQYLVNQLRPAAVPAFTVPNPYANYGFGCYCGSTNNGCC